jgi:hypothetical protein
MPTISTFYGIAIKMFFKPKEHDPSHIHAVYGEHVGVFDIKSKEMTEGDLPTVARGLVCDWLMMHQDELEEMWRTQTIVKLPPL